MYTPFRETVAASFLPPSRRQPGLGFRSFFLSELSLDYLHWGDRWLKMIQKNNNDHNDDDDDDKLPLKEKLFL